MTVEIKIYEKNPPRIEVIKVTRDNLNEVAAHIGVKRTNMHQGELDTVQKVSMFLDNDTDPLVFRIPADLTIPYEAYISREIGPGKKYWTTMRQFDLASGFFEVTDLTN